MAFFATSFILEQSSERILPDVLAHPYPVPNTPCTDEFAGMSLVTKGGGKGSAKRGNGPGECINVALFRAYTLRSAFAHVVGSCMNLVMKGGGRGPAKRGNRPG